jgi:phage gp46-like protein
MFTGDMKYKLENGVTDILLGDRDVIQDEGFETAITISLFSDRRALDDDILPDNSGDKRGWFADGSLGDNDFIGSRRWLLRRSKLTEENMRKLEEYDIEALKWMIDDGVASAITIVVVRVDMVSISETITIERPEGSPQTFKYFFNWEAQIAGE